MKSILLVLSLLFVSSVGMAQSLTIEPTPVLSAGVRLGAGNGVEDPVGYVSAKLSFIKLGDYHKVSFLSPGIGYQTDNHLNLSISPISVELNYGLTIGLDYFLTKGKELPDGTNSNGSYGISLGFYFE